MKWFSLISAVVLLGMLGAVAQGEEKDNAVIGYIEGTSFFPLVQNNAGKIIGNLQHLPLEGTLRNAFVKSDEKYRVISTSINVVDEINGNTYEYGTISSAPRKSDSFYTLAENGFPSESPAVQPALVRSFYEFFSRDKWGKHFFEDPSVLKKSNEVIAQSTQVTVRYVTDLNKDGSREAWVTCKLMYGEIARAVYEQVPEKNDWRLISYQCPGCD